MTNEEFEKVLNARLGKIKETLGVKAKEYVRNGDRLHNFRKGAAYTGKTKEEVLYGFLLKHLISIDDMINDISKGNIPSYNLVDEKIGDMMNYGVLLESCLVETIKEYNNARATEPATERVKPR